MPRQPVLMIDWGIGGLGVWRELRRARPDIDCVYLSDAGFEPYGKLDSRTLSDRLTSLIRFAGETWGTGVVTLACNAASTAIDHLRCACPDMPPLLGMLEPGVRAVAEAGVREIGVIGGCRTIESSFFARRLTPLGLQVRERVAQPLSALVEAGQLDGAVVRAAVAEVLASLEGCQALLLACTHYPVLLPHFRALMPDCLMLDPAPTAAGDLVRLLGMPHTDGTTAALRNGSLRAFTTGDTKAMQIIGKRAFDVDCQPEALHL